MKHLLTDTYMNLCVPTFIEPIESHHQPISIWLISVLTDPNLYDSLLI